MNAKRFRVGPWAARRAWLLLVLAAALVCWLVAPPVAWGGNDCDDRYAERDENGEYVKGLKEQIKDEEAEFKGTSGYRVETMKERCARLDWQRSRDRVHRVALFGAYALLILGCGWLGIAHAMEALGGKQNGDARNWAAKTIMAVLLVALAGEILNVVLGMMLGVNYFDARSFAPFGG